MNLLQLSYENATSNNGLIAFTREVRGPQNKNLGKYSVTLERLEALVSSKIWVPQSKKGGHRKFKHALANTVIEYKNHDVASGIDPGAVMTILETVQKTLNILGNDVFGYKTSNWKTEPDYKSALCRVKKK